MYMTNQTRTSSSKRTRGTYKKMMTRRQRIIPPRDRTSNTPDPYTRTPRLRLHPIKYAPHASHPALLLAFLRHRRRNRHRAPPQARVRLHDDGVHADDTITERRFGCLCIWRWDVRVVVVFWCRFVLRMRIVSPGMFKRG